LNVGPSVVVTPPFVEVMTGVPEPRRVVIELTESKAVADYREVAAVLMTLRARGFRVAVDDAGSGYAGLAHILKLDPDFIELDRELVTGIDVDPPVGPWPRPLSRSRATRVPQSSQRASRSPEKRRRSDASGSVSAMVTTSLRQQPLSTCRRDSPS
jgi:hypothetical protein